MLTNYSKLKDVVTQYRSDAQPYLETLGEETIEQTFRAMLEHLHFKKSVLPDLAPVREYYTFDYHFEWVELEALHDLDDVIRRVQEATGNQYVEVSQPQILSATNTSYQVVAAHTSRADAQTPQPVSGQMIIAIA